MVAGGALKEWPYFFLDTDSAIVFAWYIGLFVLDVFFYILFYLFNYIKEHCILNKIEVKGFEEAEKLSSQTNLNELEC